jgi:hypothetical protein
MGLLALHQEGARLLFALSQPVIKQKVKLITTNIELDRWKGLSFDEMLTDMIVDSWFIIRKCLYLHAKHKMTNSLIK